MAKQPQYTDGQRVKLPASIIRTDRGTQSREKTNPQTIKEYTALMREGVEFDPVTVFFTPEGEHVLSRGFHRLPAAIDAGRGDIDAIIRLGTLADAKWDSAGSNKHGLRCTSEDYKQAVALALSAKPKASDREIAQHLGIDGKTAAKYRPATADASAVQTRVGKDGKERKLPAKKPPASKPPAAPEKPTSAPATTPKAPMVRVKDRAAADALYAQEAADYEAAQAAPDDGLPVVEIPPTAPAVEEKPATPFVPALFGDKPADDEASAPPEFNAAVEQDRARALFRGLFLEWPKRHWPMLCEAFDEAQTEAQS